MVLIPHWKSSCKIQRSTFSSKTCLTFRTEYFTRYDLLAFQFPKTNISQGNRLHKTHARTSTTTKFPLLYTSTSRNDDNALRGVGLTVIGASRHSRCAACTCFVLLFPFFLSTVTQAPQRCTSWKNLCRVCDNKCLICSSRSTSTSHWYI